MNKHFKIAALIFVFLFAGAQAAFAKGSRVYYTGSHHTISHNGHYSGGKGSSHKGGSYKNFRTGNKYGSHIK